MTSIHDQFDTFFQPTKLWLFGRVFKGLQYVPGEMATSAAHGEGEFSDDYIAPTAGKSLPIPPRRIERKLRRGLSINDKGELVKGEAQIFARIYSFSYEAHYYRLPRPLLFLVSGNGERVDDGDGPASDPGRSTSNQAAKARPERQRPFSLAASGLEARDWRFSSDIRVWTVDRKDLAVCLDVEIGNYQEILLESMIGADSGDERAARSRGDVAGRGAGSFRGDVAGSFRGDMIGPHQNKFR